MKKNSQKKQNNFRKKIFSLIILSCVIFFTSSNILFAQNSDLDIEKEYINILEKTNQQLSLYWNPYNTILTILTALFAIFAIIFGFLVYIQSQEYKKRLVKDKEEYEKKIDEFLKRHGRYTKKLINERNIKVKKIEANLTKVISEYEKKLETLSKTPKGQKNKIRDIEKAIKELKTEKELLKSQIGPITVTPDYYSSGLTVGGLYSGEKDFHKCSHCGFGFRIKGYDPMTLVSRISGATVTCPKCGNIEQI